MTKVAWTTCLLLLLAGCGYRAGPAACIRARGAATPNLALGPTADHTLLAEAFAYRSSWPSVEAGYLFDDVSTYTELNYDDQSFFDPRDGGGYTRESVSVRTGVLVR